MATGACTGPGGGRGSCLRTGGGARPQGLSTWPGSLPHARPGLRAARPLPQGFPRGSPQPIPTGAVGKGKTVLGFRDLGRVDRWTMSLVASHLHRRALGVLLCAGVRTRGHAHGLGRERSGAGGAGCEAGSAQSTLAFQTPVFSAGTWVSKLMEGLGPREAKIPQQQMRGSEGSLSAGLSSRVAVPLCSLLRRGPGSRSHPCQRLRLRGRAWGTLRAWRGGVGGGGGLRGLAPGHPIQGGRSSAPGARCVDQE